jgi:ribosomal protein S18 acetylase RimI-like enzyme
MTDGPAMNDAELLAATADNHRIWFRRGASAAGGSAVTVGGAELFLAEEATLAFPPEEVDLDAVLAAIRDRGCRGAGCWSLAEDSDLGARLVARGFIWGWQPHWMALDLAATPAAAGEPGSTDAEEPAARPAPGRRFEVIAAGPPYAETLPYRPTHPDAEGIERLGVRPREKLVGQVAVQARGAVAGIYDMGVAPKARRRGIGLALTTAACRRAGELGCRYATLNATDEGEAVYSRAGFRSLGRGRTWWYRPGPVPDRRQVELAEAIGLGRRERLAELDPTVAELEAPLAGGTDPLQLAVLTGQPGVAADLLARAPALASRRFEPHGATLLHLAVEAGSADFVCLALAHGADLGARDRSFDGTARDWAEHLGQPDLLPLLPPVREAP